MRTPQGEQTTRAYILANFLLYIHYSFMDSCCHIYPLQLFGCEITVYVVEIGDCFDDVVLWVFRNIITWSTSNNKLIIF